MFHTIRGDSFSSGLLRCIRQAYGFPIAEEATFKNVSSVSFGMPSVANTVGIEYIIAVTSHISLR